MAEQTVELQPSESKVVSFEATPHEAKVYQVSVDGLSGNFKATEAALAAADVVAFSYPEPGAEPAALVGVRVEIEEVGYCITKYGYGGYWEPHPGCFIHNIPPGTHTVSMSLSGYKTTRADVTFESGKAWTYYFYLLKI